MKSVTRKTAFFLTLALSLATVGCGEGTPEADESDQRDLLENATTLTITGDLDDIVLDSDLTADGTVAGRIVERGIFNTKWTITSGGEPWFYISYPKEKWVYNIEGVNSGNTYGYYDMDDNCLGYAQERILESDTLERAYYIVFLDAEGNVARDYLATEKGNYLMDFDGNKVGEGKAELESFFSDDYVVTVSADEGTEVDLKDKLALCIRLSNDFMSDYSD